MIHHLIKQKYNKVSISLIANLQKLFANLQKPLLEAL